jgi:multiple sugar transport system permease protein
MSDSPAIDATPAVASHLDRRSYALLSRRTLVLIARFLTAFSLVAVFLFPIYWLVIMAFKTADEIFAYPPVWWPGSFNLANFSVLFRDGDWVTVRNSLALASVSTVISVVFGTLGAYAIERFKTGGENLAVWIISQRMLPPVVIVFPIFLLYVTLGFVDTFHGLILLYVAFSLPYVIWMMRGYIQEIPLELEESAEVDGCSRWQILWRVVFPMARTGLFATTIFTFVFVWNDFLFALVLTRTEVVTYTVQVTHYFGGQSNFWAKIAAMSVLGTLPVFFAVASLQRYFVRGISMGAIKG